MNPKFDFLFQLFFLLGGVCLDFGTENLIADEFSAELVEGVAYVAGHDEESRPVTVGIRTLDPLSSLLDIQQNTTLVCFVCLVW